MVPTTSINEANENSFVYTSTPIRSSLEFSWGGEVERVCVCVIGVPIPTFELFTLKYII